MLYKLELSYNIAKATKNIGSAKAEVAVYPSTVNLDESEKSDWPKTGDTGNELQTIDGMNDST